MYDLSGLPRTADIWAVTSKPVTSGSPAHASALTAVGGKCFCASRKQEVCLFIYTGYKPKTNIVADLPRTDITSLGQNDECNSKKKKKTYFSITAPEAWSVHVCFEL